MKSLTIILLYIVYLASSQVNHSVIVPKVFQSRRSPTKRFIPLTHSFSQQYGDIGIDLSGSVWSTKNDLKDKDIYDVSLYAPSPYCQYYSSEASLSQLFSITLTDLNIDQSVISPTTKRIYTLISHDSYSNSSLKRFLNVYQFGQKNINTPKKNITFKQLQLIDDEDVDIAMADLFGSLVISDGLDFRIVATPDKIGIVKKQNKVESGTTIDEEFLKKNELVDMMIFNQQKAFKTANMLLVWNNLLTIWGINATEPNSPTFTLLRQIKPVVGDYFSDAIMHGEQIWTLGQQKLTIYRGANEPVEVKLESSECWGMKQYYWKETTLHMICKENGINYVSEFYINSNWKKADEVLYLNRYFTQIDDASQLFVFGESNNPKILIIGSEEILLHPYAVNRQVLLDLPDGQNFQKFRGIGVENIEQVPAFSTLKCSFLIGVANKFISFFTITEDPAQIYCYVDELGVLQTLSILVQINTTTCIEEGQVQRLESICRTLVPLSLTGTLVQIQTTKKTTVSIMVFILFTGLALLFLGCAFKCKTVKDKAINQLQKRLKKLKERQNKPI